MSERRDEKDEKDRDQDEKQRGEEEKRNEKEEKERGEKWRRDPLAAAVWASILIWIGLVLLADNLGVLLRFEHLEAWSVILAGAGVILIAEAIIRLLVPSLRRPVLGTIIFGGILLAIGLGSFINLAIVLPLALVIIGVIILLRGLVGRR